MTELAPCPFCQSNAMIGGFPGEWYIRCSSEECWLSGYHAVWVDIDEAIAAWNRRPQPIVAEELIERVRKRADELAVWIANHQASPKSKRVLPDSHLRSIQEFLGDVLSLLPTRSKDTANEH